MLLCSATPTVLGETRKNNYIMCPFSYVSTEELRKAFSWKYRASCVSLPSLPPIWRLNLMPFVSLFSLLALWSLKTLLSSSSCCCYARRMRSSTCSLPSLESHCVCGWFISRILLFRAFELWRLSMTSPRRVNFNFSARLPRTIAHWSGFLIGFFSSSTSNKIFFSYIFGLGWVLCKYQLILRLARWKNLANSPLCLRLRPELELTRFNLLICGEATLNYAALTHGFRLKLAMHKKTVHNVRAQQQRMDR